MGNKRRRIGENLTDRLSDLPESLILLILSLLDTRDAVRTSLLSQRWKGLWASVQTLKFEGNSFPLLGPFKKFVCSVLLHRKPYDIRRLVFHQRSADSSFIRKVFGYAGSHLVQEIEVSDCVSARFALSCSSLRILRVHHCFLPDEMLLQLSLDSLTTLHLEGVSMIGFFTSLHNVRTMCLKKCVIRVAGIVKVKARRLSNLAVSFVTFAKKCAIVFSDSVLSRFHFEGHNVPVFTLEESRPLDKVHIQFSSSIYSKRVDKEAFVQDLTKQLKQYLPYAKLLILEQPEIKVKIARSDSHLSLNSVILTKQMKELILPVGQKQDEFLIAFTALLSELILHMEWCHDMPKEVEGSRKGALPESRNKSHETTFGNLITKLKQRMFKSYLQLWSLRAHLLFLSSNVSFIEPVKKS